MPHQGPEPHSEPGIARPGAAARRAPASRTAPRTAIWNALTALAIIAVLFVTFYGINSDRDGSPEGPALAAAASSPPQTTGQGGSRNDAAPAGEGAR